MFFFDSVDATIATSIAEKYSMQSNYNRPYSVWWPLSSLLYDFNPICSFTFISVLLFLCVAVQWFFLFSAYLKLCVYVRLQYEMTKPLSECLTGAWVGSFLREIIFNRNFVYETRKNVSSHWLTLFFWSHTHRNYLIHKSSVYISAICW